MMPTISSFPFLLMLLGRPILSKELSKIYLTIGVIFEANDDVSRKVVSVAVQNANSQLMRYNYSFRIVTETVDDNGSFSVIRKACNLLQNGLVALIAPLSEIPSRHLSSFSNRFHIPHLVTKCQFPESSASYPMNIKLYPNCDAYANIIFQYITQIEAWGEMIIIHKSDNCIMKYEYLLNQFEYHFKMRQWIHGDLKKNKEFLRKLAKSRKHKHFLVDLPYWEIRDFLIMVSTHNLTGPAHSFIFTDWDARILDLSVFKINNKVNITAFSLINDSLVTSLRTRHKNLNSLMENIFESRKLSKKSFINTNLLAAPAIIIDSINVLMEGLIRLIKLQPVFTQPMKCTTNTTWNQGISLFNAITSVDHMYGLTGRIVFNEEAQRKQYNLSVMELTENGFMKKGYWNGNNFVIFPPKSKSPVTETNEVIKPLRVTTIVSLPFVFYKDNSPDIKEHDTSIDAWNGFCIDLLNEIGADLRLNFSIHLVKDNKYGTVVDNETNPDGSEKWNGMIGELISKEADLVVAPMTISYEREKVVDFTTPFMSLGLSILFLTPQKEAPGLFSFLSPLSPLVWVYVISAYIGVSLIIYFISHVTPYEWLQIHPCDDNGSRQNQFNILNSLWFTVAALMRQGLEFCPQASSTRMVSSAWWFFTLIIISTYTANLAAFLTVEQIVLPIKSVEDLVNQKTIKYGTLKGGASEAFFERALIQTYKKMHKYMENNPDVMVRSTEEGVDKVLKSNGKYAFLLESAMNDYYKERECTLIRVGDMLDSKGYGIGFPTGSPLRDKMTKSILKLQKSQKLSNLIHKWWNEFNITEPCDTKEKGSIPTALDVHQVGGVFLLLGVGFIFASMVSVIELYVTYCEGTCKWNVPFHIYFQKELQFAVRFMSSSKKPLNTYNVDNKSRERLLILDYKQENYNAPSNRTSLHLHNPSKTSRNYPTPTNTPRIFTELDESCNDDKNCLNISHDSLESISNMCGV